MVSIAVELRHGDLRAFARRFRDRLDRQGIRESLLDPLAFNRLYVWSPVGWLDDAARDGLDTLDDEREFTLLGTEQRGAGYFKLTHPHLADAVYDAVEPRGSAVVRARHLGRVLGRAPATDLPTARRVLRVLAAGHERCGCQTPSIEKCRTAA